MENWNDLATRFKQNIRDNGDTIRDFALKHDLRPNTFRSYLSGELPNVPEEVQKIVREYVK
jgi:hypothetical protein